MDKIIIIIKELKEFKKKKKGTDPKPQMADVKLKLFKLLKLYVNLIEKHTTNLTFVMKHQQKQKHWSQNLFFQGGEKKLSI